MKVKNVINPIQVLHGLMNTGLSKHFQSATVYSLAKTREEVLR